MKKRIKLFTDELKLEIVKEYLTTSKSVKDLQEKYNFGGSNNITNWMCKFGIKYPSEDQIKLKKVISKEKGKTTRELFLEKKLKELERSLSYEQLRTETLSTMIDIAERDLKISIRKKSGPKQ